VIVHFPVHRNVKIKMPIFKTKTLNLKAAVNINYRAFATKPAVEVGGPEF
jgi:hypothetical protein